MATPPSKGKQLYHMTRLENMPSILEYGLLSRRQVEQFGLLSMDIADPDILAGRENVQLPRPLSEYVPFHFFVKNPFDGRVCNQYGPEKMAIIAINRARVPNMDSCYILTAHPLHPSAQILPYREGIQPESINPDNKWWKALDLEFPARDYNNNDIKQKCMAECLIPDKVEYFDCVFVYTDEAKAELLKCTGARRVRNYPERYIEVNTDMFPRKGS